MLTGLLDRAADRDPMANGFVICSLLDLKAVESIDAIREAFRLNAVDISLGGDLEDVEIDLGFRKQRSTRKPNYQVGLNNFVSPSTAFQPSTPPVKVGRNEPCPCGSGKKYKKCCLV
jgi:uncharacterized protein YecA (UPF0149 family)